jgi:Ca-activated chloride channel family protein
MNYYNLLRVPFDATQEEIRKAYFDSAKKYHPDLNVSQDLEEHFIEIKNAYEILINEGKRKEYDVQLDIPNKKQNNIQINAYYSRSTVPIISGKQVFFLLLDIFSNKNIENEDLPSVNLCIVLDKSTSMQGAIIEKMKLEIVNLVRSLKDEDIISIVTFSDHSEIIIRSCKVRELGHNITKINSIYASGSTEILKGLEDGINILRDSDDSTAKILLLITDGHTYGDEEKCTSLIREASNDGIIFQAVGVGTDWNDIFLDNLSTISGGETQFVTSSQELYNLLKGKLKNFSSLFTKSVKISFNLHPKVSINYAFRINPELSKLEIAPEINLGNLYSGEHLRVIFELIIEELPNDLKEIRLSHGSIKVEIPTSIISIKRYFYDFKRPTSSQLEIEKTPPIIVNALSSLSLYRMQEKAREDVEEGNYKNATRRLQNVASHLIVKGNHELAKTIMHEVQSLQATNNYSELGKKKIKYGTRSLLMLPVPNREKK